MLRPENLVWLLEERTFGYLVHYGAHFSTVTFTRDGIDYEVFVENDEFVVMEDTFDYDDE